MPITMAADSAMASSLFKLSLPVAESPRTRAAG
jgi:hypothetical protein